MPSRQLPLPRGRAVVPLAVAVVGLLTCSACGGADEGDAKAALTTAPPRTTTVTVTTTASPMTVTRTVSPSTVTTTATKVRVQTTTAVRTVTAPAPAASAQGFVDQGGGAGGSAVVYGSCSEARAAGAAPLHRGDPGYSTDLDRDEDGVACE